MMTLADVYAEYGMLITRIAMKPLLERYLADPSVEREYIEGAPGHESLVGFEPGTPEWFDGASQLENEAGFFLESNLSKLPPDSPVIFAHRFRKWLDRGEGLVIDINQLEPELIAAPPPRGFEQVLLKARGGSKWTFPQALAWALTQDYEEVAAHSAVYCKRELPGEVPWFDVSALQWLAARRCTACPKCDGKRHFDECQCLQEAVHRLGKLAQERNCAIRIPSVVLLDPEEPGAWESYRRLECPDDIDFDRLEIESKWPVGEELLEAWAQKYLISLLEREGSGRLPKPHFKREVLEAFPDLSKRGFDERVWPPIAERFGINKPGAKLKN